MYFKRAEYGHQIVASLARQLLEQYGKGFSRSALTRMCLFNENFPNLKIVATLSHKLSWSHFTEILPKKLLKEKLHQFYLQSKSLIENRGK